MQFNLEQELVTRRRMTVGQLRQRYVQIFGEVSRSSHKAYLIRKIAWRLQAQAEGDLSLRARRQAAELANDANSDCEIVIDLDNCIDEHGNVDERAVEVLERFGTTYAEISPSGRGIKNLLPW